MSQSKELKILLLCLACLMLLVPVHGPADDFSLQRQSLVREIEADVRGTSLYLNKEELNPRVMQVMAKVPRHQFVDRMLWSAAYENRPLPIGYGQTISQPYIVAIMTDLINPQTGQRILEVGTGSGYQAAVLAELVDRVYTMEIIKPLAEQVKQRFVRLGYNNISAKHGDGYYGWQEHAPFDAIVVTAAASHVPPPLVKQLKAGGKMIIPVGSRFLTQHLLLIHKDMNNKLRSEQILPVMFVPLTGDH